VRRKHRRQDFNGFMSRIHARICLHFLATLEKYNLIVCKDVDRCGVFEGYDTLELRLGLGWSEDTVASL
jgi:hypothetical protein